MKYVKTFEAYSLNETSVNKFKKGQTIKYIDPMNNKMKTGKIEDFESSRDEDFVVINGKTIPFSHISEATDWEASVNIDKLKSVVKFDKLAKQYGLKVRPNQKDKGAIIIKSYIQKLPKIVITMDIFHQTDVSPDQPDFEENLEVSWLFDHKYGGSGGGNDSLEEWLDKKTWDDHFKDDDDD